MKNGALLTLFGVVFVDLLGFGIVIPILPYYAQSHGATAWHLGWLMASYSLCQLIFAPLWGALSDRVGRRPVLLATILGTSASLFALGMADSLAGIYAARVLAGFFGANISTAFAYAADVSRPENRARAMGLVGAGFGLGFIFGPAIGGLLSRYGYAAPMYFGSALAALNFAFALWKLPEPPISAEVRAANRSRRFTRANFTRAWADPRARLATLFFFGTTLATTQLEVIFAIFLRARFGLEAMAAGGLLAFMGVVMVAMQGGLIGRLAPRFGERRLIVAGAVLCALGQLGFAWAPTVLAAAAGLFLLAVGGGMLNPSLSSLASLGAPDDAKGAVMGVFQSAGSLARVLGPLAAGALYDGAGAEAPFWSGAIVLAIVALAASRFRLPVNRA